MDCASSRIFSRSSGETRSKRASFSSNSRSRTFSNCRRSEVRVGTIASDPYQAAAYRGVITDATGVQAVPVRAWPWADVKATEFAFPNDPNALQQATAVLTPEQVASLNVEGASNGITGGIWVRDEAKKLYSLVIRPLLPDEAK